MRGILTFLFIVSIPFFAAIAHDAYLFYENQPKEFEFTKIGYLFARYAPEKFNEARQIIEPEDWKTLSVYILDQKTVVITGALAGGFLFITLLMKIFGIGPFKDEEFFKSSSLRKIDAILDGKKASKYQYKRK